MKYDTYIIMISGYLVMDILLNFIEFSVFSTPRRMKRIYSLNTLFTTFLLIAKIKFCETLSNLNSIKSYLSNFSRTRAVNFYRIVFLMVLYSMARFSFESPFVYYVLPINFDYVHINCHSSKHTAACRQS